MLKFFKNMFLTMTSINNFFTKKQFRDYTGAALVLFGIIIFVSFGVVVKDKLHTDILFKVSTFFFGVYTYLILIPFGFFNFSSIREYLIFGKKSSFDQVFRRFNNVSYLLFLAFFGYIVLFPIVGIPLLLKIFGITFIDKFLSKNLFYVIYILILVGSILWFTYHLVFQTVEIQKIKIKTALFSAIATSLGIIFNSINYINFGFLISCLLVSYLWVQYLIELKTGEIMN